MENVPSKPSAAWIIFFGSGKFWYEHTCLFSQMAKILSSMLYQAARVKFLTFSMSVNSKDQDLPVVFKKFAIQQQ